MHKLKEKLASRKLWAAIVGIVGGSLAEYYDVPAERYAPMLAVIGTYILGQGYVDGKEAETSAPSVIIQAAPQPVGDVLRNAGTQIAGNEFERATGVNLTDELQGAFGFVDGEAGRDDDAGLSADQAHALQINVIRQQESINGND